MTEDVMSEPALTLADLPRGRSALINRISPCAEDQESERRLLEIGFEEGKTVTVLHRGLLGDPLGVRVDRQMIAIRRREAGLVVVQLLEA
ncbi:MAG: ferrous iron transport protein A [Blastochloris sp.]|nr:ferrous iron transport protein A [Blastochloris sp.]